MYTRINIDSISWGEKRIALYWFIIVFLWSIWEYCANTLVHEYLFLHFRGVPNCTCSFQTFISLGHMGTGCNIGLTFCVSEMENRQFLAGVSSARCFISHGGIVCDHPLISCRHKHVQTHTYEHNTNMEILSRLLWFVRQGFMYFHS